MDKQGRRRRRPKSCSSSLRLVVPRCAQLDEMTLMAQTIVWMRTRMATSVSMPLSASELVRACMDFHILLHRQGLDHVCHVRQGSRVARMVVLHRTGIVENISLRISSSRVLAQVHDGTENILDQLPHLSLCVGSTWIDA